VAVTERGFIEVDKHCAPTSAHSSRSRDIIGQPMLARERGARRPCRRRSGRWSQGIFRRHSDSVGGLHQSRNRLGRRYEDEAKKQGRTVGKAKFPWTASGRAIANGATRFHQDHRGRGNPPRDRWRDCRHKLPATSSANSRSPSKWAPIRKISARHPPAPRRWAIGRHGRRGVRRCVHRLMPARKKPT